MDDDASCYATALRSEDVIGPADGTAVHKFNPDSSTHDCLKNYGIWKLQCIASAHQDQFRPKGKDGPEIIDRKLVQVLWWPVRNYLFRGDNEARCVAHFPDHNCIVDERTNAVARWLVF